MKTIKHEGFTMVEAAIVLLVIGILMSVALPNYLSSLASMSVKESAQQFSYTVDKIRGEVKQSGNCQRLSLVNGNTLKIEKYTNGDCTSLNPAIAQVPLSAGSTVIQKTGSSITFVPPMALNKSGLPADFAITNRNATRNVRITGVLGRVVIR